MQQQITDVLHTSVLHICRIYDFNYCVFILF